MGDLRTEYESRFETILVPLAKGLQSLLEGYFLDVPKVDRITVRAKSVDHFMSKAQKTFDGRLGYSDPLNQIQDQIGARIIAFYSCDVPRISAIAERYFRHIESKTIVPDSESEFGYFGTHFIMLLPSDLFGDHIIRREDAPHFFELQIKTLFQHAWSEANHDLGYKPEWRLSPEDRRKIAFTAAQAWGADLIFNELRQKGIAQVTESVDT